MSSELKWLLSRKILTQLKKFKISKMKFKKRSIICLNLSLQNKFQTKKSQLMLNKMMELFKTIIVKRNLNKFLKNKSKSKNYKKKYRNKKKLNRMNKQMKKSKKNIRKKILLKKYKYQKSRNSSQNQACLQECH